MDKFQLENFLRSVEKRALRMVEISGIGRDDALDILQDSMFRFVDRYAGKNPEEWAPLFYRVLQNRMMDFHRRQKVRSRWFAWWPAGEDEEEDPLSRVADEHTPDPVARMAGEQLADELLHAVESLPLRQQQAFMLRNWEGLSVEETARAMECSEGSVKTHYSRAIHKLRDILSEHEDETA